MISRNFRLKLTILALAPLVILIAGITGLAIYQTTQLGRSQAGIFQAGLLEAKRAELRNYMELGYTAIKDIYENAAPDDQAAKQRVLDIFRNMEYGPDGYFFVYDYDGTTLAHPRLPNLEGKNLYNLTDRNGKLLIQDLIKNAKAGGGFTQYVWEKPSTGKTVPKLGYSIALDRWHWMVGTGLYLDDIRAAIDTMETRMVHNARNTFLLLAAIAIASLVVVAVIGLAVNLSEGKTANRKLVLMARKTVSFQERERRRISRELHDGINQLLVSARYKLETLDESLAGDESRRGTVAAVDGILQRGIQDLRRMAWDLRPSVLDDLGLAAALKELAQEFGARKGVDVQFDSALHDLRWPSQVETALYRIAQEAFNNIEKHCDRMSTVSVAIRQRLGAAHLTISDDGPGFDLDEAERSRSRDSGMGLQNIRDRVDLLGGRLQIVSRPGAGTCIRIKVPIEQDEDTDSGYGDLLYQSPAGG